MDKFKDMSAEDMEKIVLLYLTAVVETKQYSLAGEAAVVSALKSLDENVSSRIYDEYRNDIPTLPNTPRDDTVEYELGKLEDEGVRLRKYD